MTVSASVAVGSAVLKRELGAGRRNGESAAHRRQPGLEPGLQARYLRYRAKQEKAAKARNMQREWNSQETAPESHGQKRPEEKKISVQENTSQ